MDKKPVTAASKSVSKPASKPAPAQNKKLNLGEYFKGIKTETKKVVWPTKKELGSYTGVVLFTCFAFAIGFWAIDSVLLSALKLLINFTY